MKSRISFFDRGVAKNTLRRCWPFYLAYLVFLHLSFSLPLRQLFRVPADHRVGAVTETILTNGIFQSYAAAAIAVAAAMLMFSYLYNARSCGMMNALPLRRETMFSTAWLLGLLPLLACQVLVLIPVLLSVPRGESCSAALGQWLAMSAMSMTAFYGMAVFCAMLTGSLLILPLVYLVLNLTAVVVESCVQGILYSLVYGYAAAPLRCGWLSPLYQLAVRMRLEYDAPADGGAMLVSLRGLDTLAVYCAAGLVLSLLALLLYRKRRMESATDVVAIPLLKPVFKYCMTLGTALVMAVSLPSLLGLAERGTSAVLPRLLLLLLGAALGYFVAEMLMQKSVKVFRGNWRGLLVCAAALILVFGAAELDLFGFEKRLPRAEDVESVTVVGLAEDICQPENVERTIALHENLLLNKRRFDRPWLGTDRDVYGTHLVFRYRLGSGKVLSREYMVSFTRSDLEDPDSAASVYQALGNAPELLALRAKPRIQVRTDTIDRASLSYWEGEGHHFSSRASLSLTPEQAVDFYENAILPDLAAGRLMHFRIFDSAPGQRPLTVEFDLDLLDGSSMDRPRRDRRTMNFDYRFFTIYEDSERCLAWLEENTELPIYIQDESFYGEEIAIQPQRVR